LVATWKQASACSQSPGRRHTAAKHGGALCDSMPATRTGSHGGGELWLGTFGGGKLPELWRGDGSVSPVRHPSFWPQGPETSQPALRSANCILAPNHCSKANPTPHSEVQDPDTVLTNLALSLLFAGLGPRASQTGSACTMP
jgi:hypothetical protein